MAAVLVGSPIASSMQATISSRLRASHPVTPGSMTSGMFPRGGAITGRRNAIAKPIDPDVVTSVYGWTSTLHALNQYCNSSSRRGPNRTLRSGRDRAADSISRASCGSWHSPKMEKATSLPDVRDIASRKSRVPL